MDYTAIRRQKKANDLIVLLLVGCLALSGISACTSGYLLYRLKAFDQQIENVSKEWQKIDNSIARQIR